MSELKLKGKQRQAAASGKLGESAQHKQQQKQTRWQPHYAQFSSSHSRSTLPCPSSFDCYTHTHAFQHWLSCIPAFALVCGPARVAFLQLFLYFSHSVKFSKCHFAVISWIIRLQLRWNNRIQMKKLCRRLSSVFCRQSQVSVFGLPLPSQLSIRLHLQLTLIYLSLSLVSLSLFISNILPQFSGGSWVQSFHFDCWLSSAIMIKQQGELSLPNSPTSYATHTYAIWQTL